MLPPELPSKYPDVALEYKDPSEIFPPLTSFTNRPADNSHEALALPAVDEVGRPERNSVLPLHSPSQLEGVGLSVRADRVPLREPRDDPEL